MLDFPRYVFQAGKTKLVESQEDHDKELKAGWFSTVLEALAAESDPQLLNPNSGDKDQSNDNKDQGGDKEPSSDDKEPPPTRAELEFKAKELGIKFNPQLGDKRLAELIEAKLGG